MKAFSKLLVFAGRSNPALSASITQYIGIEPGKADIMDFPDGETSVRLHSDVRGADVFVIQSTCAPVNQNLMELLIILDALKRASAGRLTVVMPYFGYARQDRKDTGRVPISAKLVANLLVEAGADRVLTIDLHAAQIQGFFDIPVDHMYAAPIFTEHFRKLNLPDLAIVGPDLGSMKRAWGFAKRLGASVALLQKERVSATQVEAGFLIGDVKGKNVIIVDDVLATCGSVREAVRVLREHGARSVAIAATHPVLCGPAAERLRECEATKVLISDTIPVNQAVVSKVKNVEILSVAKLLGEAIVRIHTNRSVSQLFLS